MFTEKEIKKEAQEFNNLNSSNISNTISSTILHMVDGDTPSKKTLIKLDKALNDGRVSEEHKKLIKKIKKANK